MLNEVLKRPAHELSGCAANCTLWRWPTRNARTPSTRFVYGPRAGAWPWNSRPRIDVVGLDDVMVLEMLKEVTKAPVPQRSGGGGLCAYLETQPMARLEEPLDKMRSLHGDPGTVGAARPSLTKGDDQGDIQDVQREAK
jgi:hypothetical protein